MQLTFGDSMARLKILILTTWVTLSCFCAPLHAQSAPDKITLGTITLSLDNLPICVAQEKGFFVKENIFLEAVVLNASTLAIPMLIAGAAQVAAPSAMTTIGAVENGAPLKIVGGLTNALVYDLYASPKHKTFKDFNGSTIGVAGLNTSDTMIFHPLPKTDKYVDLSDLAERRRNLQ
jgi:ABC-type nitrate/sulfonate/bicarbonate transport system substrate-binding protein